MAASDRSAGVHFDKVIQTLRGQVQDMRQEFLESGIPISDDHQALHTFCEKLEFLLKFGIKERTGLLGGRRDLWQYLCKCLADRRNIHDGLRVIKANNELKTGVGRARCFVRYCLVHQCLADVLQQCVGNSPVTQQFYQSGSLLLNPSLTATLITTLYELCDVTFDLPPTGHDLDVSWPTFARLGLGGSWRPPSRSMSISSLSSYVSQYSEAIVGSVPQSPTMASVSEDFPDFAGSPQNDLQRENQHLRDTVTQLREQLAKIETFPNSTGDKEETKQEDSNDTSIAQINDLEQRLEECKKDYEKIFLELSISQQRNRVFEIIEKELQSRIEELTGHVKSFEISEREYKYKIDDLECKVESTTAANDRLSISLRQLSETKSDEDSSNVDQVSQLTSKVAQLELSSTDLQTSVTDYLHRINQLQEEVNLLQEDKVHLGQQLEQAEKEKTKLRTNIRKVSSNWFERKDRHSESEGDSFDKVEDGSKVKDHGGESIGQLLRQIELSEKRCCEHRKRVQDCEKIIDDQGIIILGMKEQMDSYFSDNQKMSKQLNAFAGLFEDLERINNTKVREGVGENNSSENDSTETPSFDDLPTQADFKDLSTSVSKTYIKLKDLIFEKRSLVTEIERLNTLNLELNSRVQQQESRLSSVSDALQNTWMLVSNMKEQHAQLHSTESILRYELKEKRTLLTKLKEELECSREQWNRIRQKNSESQVEYDNLKSEFNERKRLAGSLSEDSSDESKPEVVEGAIAFVREASPSFEPPVDMLLDMAIEYGVVDADDETSTNIVAMMEGQDLRQDRLQVLEDQCCYLYQKLMSSTSRSLALASRLTHLHRHYSADDDEDDEEDEEDYEEDDMEQLEEIADGNNILDQYESEMTSPDPDSSDTAYVSEAEAGSVTGGPGNMSSEEEQPAPGTSSPTTLEEEEPLEVPEDDLSRRLINFLPRKIEILRHDNQKLEEKCSILFEERAQLRESVDTEHKLRIQLEKKLEHLGKCVDELKLERNGKISEVENQLKQKVEAATERETTLLNVTEELESLKKKYDERGDALSATKEKLTKVETDLEQFEKQRHQAEVDLDQKVAELSASNAQLSVSKASMLTLKESNEALHEESKTLQTQLQDLRFQLSSQAMDKETTDKDQVGIVQESNRQESERLTAQVSDLEETLHAAEEECASIKEKLQLAESLATQETCEAESAKERLKTTQEQLTREGDKSQQLTEDNNNLREKLIQLLKEKDALWQANQRLGEASTHNRNWMEDNTAQECIACKITFSLTKRRHHCRACGGIFCTGCSDNWVMLASSSKRVRVCDGCITLQSELAALVNPILHQADPQEQMNQQSQKEQTSKNKTKSASSGPLPIGTEQPNDEDFSVISEDEVNASQLSSSADSSPAGEGSGETWQVKDSQATPILTPHLLTTSPPTDSEVWVGAGTRVTVPLELPSGVTLSWHFTSEPKSVSFAVLHHPKHSRASPSDPETRVLIPTTRVASAQGPVKGKLMSKQPGVYTLVFDNSSSKLTAKKVTYTLNLIESISSSTDSSKSLTQSPSGSKS